jgi:hypothetical protein
MEENVIMTFGKLRVNSAKQSPSSINAKISNGLSPRLAMTFPKPGSLS